MPTHIAYFRVSTDKQGRSGLGLDAQQQAVRQFIGGEPDASYIEVESGANRDRPQLAAAIKDCKRTGASLVVAKLDRLARDVQLILSIVDSGIVVRFVDLPEINPADPTGRLMLTMMASFAEFERRIISKRTREALAAKKARGFKLGSPTPERGSAAGNAVIRERADAFAIKVLPLIRTLREQGATSLRDLAAELTARNVPTAKGGTVWHASAVANVLKREALH